MEATKETAAAAPAKSKGTIYAAVAIGVLVLVIVAGVVVLSGRGTSTDNQGGPGGEENLGENLGITFSEDFTGETLENLQLQGWSAWFKPAMSEVTGFGITLMQGTFAVNENGSLQIQSGAGGLMYAANWSNYTLNFKLNISVSSLNSWAGLAFRTDSTWESGLNGQAETGKWPQNSYILQLRFSDANKLWKIVDNTFTEIESVSRTFDRDVWYDVQLVANGSSIKVYVNDEILFDVTDNSLTRGGIGLLHCNGPVYFDDLTVEL